MCGILWLRKILFVFKVVFIMRKIYYILFVLAVQNIYSQNFIVISKHDLKLFVVSNNNDTLFSAPISVGTNYGDKKKKGDRKTPEGTFKIIQIQNSSKWTHDFKDGYGARKGAYGPYFFRLKTPKFSGIGIHGTCFPNQIGLRCSEGCIRLRNSDLKKLRHFVYIGMRCTIEKDF